MNKKPSPRSTTAAGRNRVILALQQGVEGRGIGLMDRDDCLALIAASEQWGEAQWSAMAARLKERHLPSAGEEKRTALGKCRSVPVKTR